MAQDQIELVRNKPKQVTPTGAFMIVQNASRSEVNVLYVSSHGDIHKPWMEIKTGCSVKFSEPTYLLQRTMDGSAFFPVIEGA